MKFSFVTIHLTDLEQSIAFYKEVIGLQVTKRFSAGPNQEIAFLGNQESPAEVELIAHKDVETLSHDSHLSLGFAVADLDVAMAELETKGISIASGPFQPNPNTRFCFIEDPNGVTVELIQQT